MKKETDIQVQEAQRISNNMNLKRSTPRQMIIKMARVTERILKGAREKQRATNKGFFAKTLQTRREWHDVSKVLKVKNLKLSILYKQDNNSEFTKRYSLSQARIKSSSILH